MKDPKTVRVACTLYRALLLLYPVAHQREYGAEMEQLFRDQCRAVTRHQGAPGVLRLLVRTLIDFAISASREHAAKQIVIMKSVSPSKASLILIIAAVLLQQVAIFLAFHGAPFATICLWLGTLALVLRALCEVNRPLGEWGRALIWAFGIALVYSLICPAWGHLTERSNLPIDVLIALKAHLCAFAINLVVPIVKSALAIFHRLRA